MLILSFAKTTDALLAGRKSVTRRDWADRTHEMWSRRIGRDFQCWDKSPRCGGRLIGYARLLSVTREWTCEIPESDWEAEGFAYMAEQGLLLDGEMDCAILWGKWKADAGKVTSVIRFDRFEAVCGIEIEDYLPHPDPYLSLGRDWSDSGDYDG